MTLWRTSPQQVFIAHAAPGSKTEAFARKLANAGKSLLTLDSTANSNLIAVGASLSLDDSGVEVRWGQRSFNRHPDILWAD